MEMIQRGLDKDLIRFDDRRRFITYLHQGKKNSWSNPDERIHAETFIKLILIYNYPVEHIRHGVSTMVGNFSWEADIVVYKDDTCEEPHIVINCNRQEISEQEFGQAVDRLFGFVFAAADTTRFIWVTSRIKNAYFEIGKSKGSRKDAPDIPSYGLDRPAKYKWVKGGDNIAEEEPAPYGRPRFFELEEATEDGLTRRFKQAHDALWAGGEMNPSKAFDELEKLIFCKIWDEMHTIDDRSKKFRLRKKGEPYFFQVFADETEKELAERIKSIYSQGRVKDPAVFSDNIRLSHKKIRTIVSYLEGISLVKTDLDSKGRAFEAFIGSYFRGGFGQYFTPRKIVTFVVSAMPITKDSRVLDTACGSGGFLLYVLDSIRADANRLFGKGSAAYQEYWRDFAQSNLFGIEINEGIARTAKMNVIIHQAEQSNIIMADGLCKSETLIEQSGNQGFQYGSFDFILTNPPFGSIIKQTEKTYLYQYHFGQKKVDWLGMRDVSSRKRVSQNTEVLFIEQCYNFLKPGGYMAIIVPDGILTNSSLHYVRDQIEEWFRIVAIVSLPQAAFTNTGATVKSSVLFLRKRSPERCKAIIDIKKRLQEKVKTKNAYRSRMLALNREKNDILKRRVGFNHVAGKTDETITSFREWKSQITSDYNQKLKALREELIDEYLSEKQKALKDYPIFMAIAEDIGYDATGRATGKNELEDIGKELRRFIAYIQKEESI